MRITEPQRRRNDGMLYDAGLFGAIPLVILMSIWFLSSLKTMSLTYLLAFVPAGVIAFLIVRMVWRIQRVDAIHWMTATEICGACTHSLHGLKPEHDGCTVCPECGAAWIMPLEDAARDCAIDH